MSDASRPFDAPELPPDHFYRVTRRDPLGLPQICVEVRRRLWVGSVRVADCRYTLDNAEQATPGRIASLARSAYDRAFPADPFTRVRDLLGDHPHRKEQRVEPE